MSDSRAVALTLRRAQIDVDEHDSVNVVKRKLQAAVGIPASDMKIRLGGYNQFVMIDTTTNIRVGTCGLTTGAPHHARLPSQQKI